MIGTVSTTNREFVPSLGAEMVIDYTTTPFEQVVRDVGLVLDPISGETLQHSMGVVKPGGTLISRLEQPWQEQAQECGIRTLNNAVLPTNEHVWIIVQLIREGQGSAIVGKTFPLAEARQANELSQTGYEADVLCCVWPG